MAETIHHQDSESSHRPWLWAGAIAIVIATFIAYIPALGSGFIWDDDDYVTENELLLDMDGLKHIWLPEPIDLEADRPPKRTPQYYPVVFTTFWIEHMVWGEAAGGYHFVNVLLHIAAALVLWRVLTMIGIPGGVTAAGIVAALFALHPVHVESVAWITERKNVLSGLLYLSAAWAFLQFDDGREQPDAKGVWGFYGAALVLFVGAILSKSVTCSLPAALILVMLYRRTPINFTRLALLAPMFVLGLLAAMNTARVEREHVGAEGVEFAMSFVERGLVASKALLFYPEKILWPHPLIFIYPRWEIDTTSIAAWVSVAVVLVFATVLIWKFTRGVRGPFVALAFFAGTVFPAIGFFNVYPHQFSFVADHFQYLASIGVLVLIVSGLFWLWPSRSKAIAAALLAVATIFMVLSVFQGGKYADENTLWLTTVRQNPDAWMSWNNLGHLALERNDPEAAERYLRECLQRKPEHFNAQSNLAEALRRLGRHDEALEAIDRAMELGLAMVADGRFDSHASIAKEHHQRGLILAALGRATEAEAAYRRSLELQPDAAPVDYSLAMLLLGQDRASEAAPHLEAVVAWDAVNLVALDALGQIAEEAGRHADAARWYKRATQSAVAPADQMQMAANYIRFICSCPDAAVRNVAEGVVIAENMNQAARGQFPEVLDVLAAAYAEAGRFEEAAATAEQAAQLARATNRYDLAAELESRRDLYRQRRTFWSP